MSVRQNRISKIDRQIQQMQEKIASLQRKKKNLQSVDSALQGKIMRQHYARYCAIAIAKLIELDPKLRGRIDTFLQVMGTSHKLNFLPFDPKTTTQKSSPFQSQSSQLITATGDHYE